LEALYAALVNALRTGAPWAASQVE